MGKAVPAGPVCKREQSGSLWFASQKNFGNENGSVGIGLSVVVVSATTLAFHCNAIYIIHKYIYIKNTYI